VIEAPGDGWDVDVNVTVSPTLGASGVKVNEAVGRPPPPPDWALASTPPAASESVVTKRTATRVRSAMGFGYPVVRA
jgi:hypothetical protein